MLPFHPGRFGNPAALAGGSSFVGPLDGYTTNLLGAWSVSRRLLTTSRPLICVRRSLDNDERDIGATADGSLDVAELLSFADGGSAFIRYVYNQFDSDHDFGQSLASAQPRIVASGVLDTLNGQPAMKTTAAGQHMLTSFSGAGAVGVSAYVVAEMAANFASQNYARLLSLTADGVPDYASEHSMMLCRSTTAQDLTGYFNSVYGTVSMTEGTAYVAQGKVQNGSPQLSVRTNKNAAATASSGGTPNFTFDKARLFRSSTDTVEYWSGTVSELLIYGTWHDATTQDAIVDIQMGGFGI